MERQVITTADGSKTILIPGLNESYHSRHGALTESRHIFIDAGYRYAAAGFSKLNILEVGFGTGLNALLSLLESQKDLREVYYLGVEPFPVSREMLDHLDYPGMFEDDDVQAFFEEIHGGGSSKKIGSHFTLDLITERLEDVKLEPSFFNLVYFDAFAPAVCPELWEAGIFNMIASSMVPGAVLVTYSCKGDVKRAMKAAGFAVEKLPGPPGKREFLRAVKT